ncbi:MAG: hypothetical protein ACFBSE_25415 [Prochloraceae cyanobacterium]
MSETSQQTASKAEIDLVIAELEEYRNRIVNEVLAMGKKIKLSQKAVNSHLEKNPEIAKIDAALAALKNQQKEG